MKAKTIVRVRDVMKSEFDQIDSMATVQQALQTMKHVEAKALVVKKRDADDAIGMVTLPEIARQVIAKDRSPERVNVYEVMTKPVITVEPEMDIRHCARLFSQFRISRAPVVENAHVIGIVSLTDMVLHGMCQFPLPQKNSEGELNSE